MIERIKVAVLASTILVGPPGVYVAALHRQPISTIATLGSVVAVVYWWILAVVSEAYE